MHEWSISKWIFGDRFVQRIEFSANTADFVIKYYESFSEGDFFLCEWVSMCWFGSTIFCCFMHFKRGANNKARVEKRTKLIFLFHYFPWLTCFNFLRWKNIFLLIFFCDFAKSHLNMIRGSRSGNQLGEKEISLGTCFRLIQIENLFFLQSPSKGLLDFLNFERKFSFVLI